MENNKITCYHTHIELNNYELGDCPELERRLSSYDKIYYKSVPIGMVYETENKILKIPTGVSANWLSQITDRPVDIIYETDPYEKMSLRLSTFPRSELQEEAISFLAGKGEFKNYSKYSQLILNLDTAEGKTFIAIALAVIKRLKTIVIVNSKAIMHQWADKFKQYTDIDENSICNISGSSMCQSIINNPKKYSNYKVFIVIHDTIRSFGDSHGWENVHELFKAIKVGIKIYDEAHLEFTNIIKINSYSDTKYTYYLTATFGRSELSENRVYKFSFMNIPKYIQRQRTEYLGKPYIKYISLLYKSNPTLDDIARLKNKYGFKWSEYTKYQLIHDEYFYSNIDLMVKKFTVDKRFKTLLLIGTIDGIEDVADFIKNKYPDITVGVYHSKINPNNKIKALEADLIISTSKSLGVGADIPGLRALINTESFKSNIIVEQIVGRLRRPKDDLPCYYIEIVDKAFRTITSQYRARSKVITGIVGESFKIKI